MTTASYGSAFSLEPVLTLKIAGRDHTVPPLTFGRFQGLLTAMRVPPDFTADAWYPIVQEAVPGLRADLWAAECPEPRDVARVGAVLLRFFLEAHDWDFIWDALGWGRKTTVAQQESEAVTQSEFLAAAAMVARAHGMTLPDVLSMRVEGYFVLVMALKAQNDKAKETESSSKEKGIGSIDQLLKKVPPVASTGPGKPEPNPLLKLMDAANKAAGVTVGK